MCLPTLKTHLIIWKVLCFFISRKTAHFDVWSFRRTASEYHAKNKDFAYGETMII